jgi:hypothetical protein
MRRCEEVGFSSLLKTCIGKDSMKKFKWSISLCILLVIADLFLMGRATIQAHASRARVVASAADYELASVAPVTSNNVWAVGKRGTNSTFSSLIEHWDGSRWKVVSSPNPKGATDTELTGVAALSSSNVWAVGFARIGTQQQSVVEHWNGHAWSLVKSPNQSGSTRLLGISTLSANNIWAVGVNQNGLSEWTLIEHWDGSKWQIVPSANPSGSLNELTGVKALSANDIWAVGDALGYATGGGGGLSTGVHPHSGGGGTFSGFHPVAEHWNGSTWNAVGVPDPPDMYQQVYQSVTATSPNDVWAVGNSFTNSNSFAFVAHWNGLNWQSVHCPTPGINSTLLSVAALSSQDIWAVGSYHIDDHSVAIPLTEHWNGQQWTIIASPTGNVGYVEANGVGAVSSQNAWFVGGSGLTEHWNGTDWQVVTTPTPAFSL